MRIRRPHNFIFFCVLHSANMRVYTVVCEIFADKIGLLFNPLISKLLCYNVDNPDIVYVTLRNTTVRTSLHEKHLVTIFMIEILRNMYVDLLVKQMQFYVILDVVIVVLLLSFIEPFVWTYMIVNCGTKVANILKKCIPHGK